METGASGVETAVSPRRGAEKTQRFEMEEKARGESTEGAEASRLYWSGSDGLNRLTNQIIGAATEVHRHLGPGLLESAYEECLCYELNERSIQFERQVPVPVSYKKLKLSCSYRLDLLVEERVIVEVKAIDQILPVHPAQLLTYLKATNKQVGLLINFQVPLLKQGIKRIANNYVEAAVAQLDASAPSASTIEQQGAPDISLNSLRSSPRLRVSAEEGRPH
jgi:GxxExxY protein